jgi:hypothetical protein
MANLLRWRQRHGRNRFERETTADGVPDYLMCRRRVFIPTVITQAARSAPVSGVAASRQEGSVRESVRESFITLLWSLVSAELAESS